MLEIVAIVGAVLLGLLLIFLVYRAARTYDAGAHATFITTKGGNFYGALRAPMTIWDPTIKVLREKHAPDLKIMTTDATGAFYEKSLVNRSNGEISLRVHTCAPRPFMSTTTDKRMLLVKTKVAFALDIERIQIPTQMESFGTTLAARIENLFDNAVSEYEDQDVFKHQREIEHRVLRDLREMEFPADESQALGMPLGITVYEAMFSFERPQKPINRDLANGPIHALGSSHIVRGRKDVKLRFITENLPSERMQRHEAFNVIPEKLNAYRVQFVDRENLHSVTTHTERATSESNVIAGVLNIDEHAEERVAVSLLAHSKSYHAVDIFLRGAQTINRRHCGHHDDVTTSQERVGGRVPQTLDLLIDG